MKVGVFADGLWGLKFIKILNLDKNFFLDFVVLRKKFDNKILQFCKNKKIKYFVFDNINKKKNLAFNPAGNKKNIFLISLIINAFHFISSSRKS